MPEGLQTGLTREEFTDLIAYLTTLRQPENLSSSVQGMPGEIQPLAKSIELYPFVSHELSFLNPTFSSRVMSVTGSSPLPNYPVGRIISWQRSSPEKYG